MKTVNAVSVRAAFVLVLAMGGPSIFGQSAAGVRDGEGAIERAHRQEKVQRIQSDKAGYAAAIVARWEGSARDSGRWDRNYSADLLESLMKLDSENLLAAGEASSYPALMTVLATGRSEPTREDPFPNSLGQNFQDLVYTPVLPCRIVDTRLAVAGGPLSKTTPTPPATS